MLLALSAQAQTTPVITEADIARARRAQPTITDQDIEQFSDADTNSSHFVKHRKPYDNKNQYLNLEDPPAPTR
ncbi:hypothetical protein AAHH78_43165, partial [Burkholderia pseudomallei]